MMLRLGVLITTAFGLFSGIAGASSLHKSGVYIGTSFGASQLSGKRTDSIANSFLTVPLFTNKRMQDTSLEGSLFAGYRFVPPHTNFAFSLDAFFSYGPYENTVFKDVLQGVLPPPTTGNQVATLKRNIGYGVTARIGYIVHQKLMPYVLVGIRTDRFTYTSIGPDASQASFRKLLMGTDMGVGVETCLAGIRTALEVKYTQYQRLNRFAIEPVSGSQAIINTRPGSASISLRFSYQF